MAKRMARVVAYHKAERKGLLSSEISYLAARIDLPLADRLLTLTKKKEPSNMQIKEIALYPDRQLEIT